LKLKDKIKADKAPYLTDFGGRGSLGATENI
jgi:hypothetical protein